MVHAWVLVAVADSRRAESCFNTRGSKPSVRLDDQVSHVSVSLLAASYAVLRAHPSVCFNYRITITGTRLSVLLQNVNRECAVIPDINEGAHALGSLPCSLSPLYCPNTIC